MAQVPPPIYATVPAIYRWYEQQESAQKPRPYLWASQIGRRCERELWLSFRWVSRPQFDGRMLRLFRRGQREEAAFVEDLRAIGVIVHDVDRDGRQFTVEAHGGHFRGHLDGAAVGIPEAPGTWHVLEFKTHNSKSFDKLTKDGVRLARPARPARPIFEDDELMLRAPELLGFGARRMVRVEDVYRQRLALLVLAFGGHRITADSNLKP